uniref:Uncharacterized protein n=1 Tax=Tanacetum cinerariifolium TaxID=118510 RepID=A0A699I7L8_TANCI|nr:hypothetical protein [Tanacetum cinerariifolium]
MKSVIVIRVVKLGLLQFYYVVVPVSPEVGAATIASPVGVLEFDTHSSSEADPLESSLPPVSMAPMVSPFLCSNDSYPIGRLYRTHPGGPCRVLIVRKSVRPLSSYCLAWKYTSHHLDHFTFGSSSGHSSLDHSSSGHSISGHSLSRHTPPDTTVVDSSVPPRFVYPPLSRTPRYSEAYRRWRSASLSTMNPPTTSESSVRDSSFESSARPSHKRCRSLAATVTLSIHASRALVLYRADLLLRHKRFRDSISRKDSVEEDINTDALADVKTDATTIEVTVDRDFDAGIDAGIGMEVDVGIDIEDEVETRSSPMIEVLLRLEWMWLPRLISLMRVEGIKMGQRELEARSLLVERAILLERVVSLKRSNARL